MDKNTSNKEIIKIFEIAKKLNSIADYIDNYEFDDDAELCFMESIQTICVELYEMCLMYGNKLKKLKGGEK